MGRVAIRLQPRASRTGFYGERDGAILARVNQPPVDGRANRALIGLVAERLGIARSRVELVRGGSSRVKLLEIEGLEPDRIRTGLLG